MTVTQLRPALSPDEQLTRYGACYVCGSPRRIALVVVDDVEHRLDLVCTDQLDHDAVSEPTA